MNNRHQSRARQQAVSSTEPSSHVCHINSHMNRSLLFLIPLLGFAVLASSQQRANPPETPNPAPQAATPSSALPAQQDYVLGAGDQLSLVVPDLDDEFKDKKFRIEMTGDLNLPLAGRLHAAGLTVSQLEEQVADRLSKILKDPQVVINIAEFHSQPVSILGAVGTPGVRQIEGRKTLFEVVSLAGGLRPDAGNTINITRDLAWGAIPLPNAKSDPTGKYSVASVSVKSVLNATDPAENIIIMPGDIISVSKAELVYAVGSVKKPGGFSIGQSSSLTTLQVLSLAEGLEKTAAPDKAKILRTVPGSSTRTEIDVNLKQLMAGKGADVPLHADDILFVPNSGAKSATYRTIDALVNAATGAAIYAR